ncbi:MAG: hypothetical protein JO152_06375 [Mycobacteriaceae bacterium]|nr:hypothetical protein [Mycobacteriaceae bacterium]
MRNILRVLAFDVVAPLAAIGGLVILGFGLGWPVWWVPVCSVLGALIAEGMAANFILARRDRVTFGTDDERPGLRFAVVAVTTAVLVAGAVVGYVRWTVPDRAYDADVKEVVQMAATVSEAIATFSPQDPTSSIDRAAGLMGPKQAEVYKAAYQKNASELAAKNVTSQASAVSVGVESMSKDAASVAVIMRATQTTPGSPPDRTVVGVRVALTEHEGKWQVFDVTPVSRARTPEQGGES